MELWQYYQVLRRRGWIVAAVVIAAATAALAANHPRSGDFFATATLSLPDLKRFDIVAGPLTPAGEAQDQQVTQAVGLIESRDVAERVVQQLNLAIRPEELQHRVRAEKERFGPLMRVTVSGRYPTDAVRLTNAVADAAAAYDQEVRRREVTLGREFVERQAQQALSDLTAAENALLAFEKEHAIALNTPASAQGSGGNAQGSGNPAQAPGVMVVAGLQGELLGLDLSLQEVEAKLSAVRNQLKGQTATRSDQEITENPVTRQLRSQLVSLEVALTSELAVHTEKFPSVVTLRARIQAIKDRLKTELDKVVSTEQVRSNPIYDALNQNRVGLEVDKVALLAKREALLRAIQDNQQAVPRLAEMQMERSRLGRAVEILGRRYADLQGLVTQARLKEQQAQNLGSLAVVGYAHSAIPSPLQGLRIKLTLAALLGLLGGLGLAFSLEYLDHSIGAPETTERLLNVPALAAIPYHNPPFDEAYRLLRVNLAAGGGRGDAILATGLRPGEGTSTIVANLARAFAGAGRRTIVVDAAFHRPAQHTRFGVANERGLADVLTGEVALQDVLVHTETPGIRVLPSGRMQNTDGLVGSNAIADVIAGLRQQGDVVLIDTPPAGTFTDAFCIAPAASSVLLVLDARQVPHGAEQVKNQFDRLGARVAGVALTKMRPDLVDSYVNQERFYNPRPRLMPSPAAAAAVLGMFVAFVRAGVPAFRR